MCVCVCLVCVVFNYYSACLFLQWYFICKPLAYASFSIRSLVILSLDYTGFIFLYSIGLGLKMIEKVKQTLNNFTFLPIFFFFS